MKRAIIIIAALLLIPAIATAGVQFFPDFAAVIDRADRCNKLMVIAGAFAGIVAHEAGHVAALEMRGIDYEFHGTRISGHGDRDCWSDMAGFGSQIAAGTLLPPEWDFTMGYNLGTLFAVASYPARCGMRDGDFAGNRWLEWCVFTLAATINVMRIEW